MYCSKKNYWNICIFAYIEWAICIGIGIIDSTLHHFMYAVMNCNHSTVSSWDLFQDHIAKSVDTQVHYKIQFSSVQLIVQLGPTHCNPMDCSTWGFSVYHQFHSLLKLMSIKSVMISNHLVLCQPLLLLSLIFPSIRVYSN